MPDKSFTESEAHDVGEQIGIDWSKAPFDVDQFRRGIDVELEHGLHDPSTNVTGDDSVLTGKIALAHLNEFPDYYTRLERMEEEARREQSEAKWRCASPFALREEVAFEDAARSWRGRARRASLAGRLPLAPRTHAPLWTACDV